LSRFKAISIKIDVFEKKSKANIYGENRYLYRRMCT
jgi:hypothetical protein